MTIQVVDTELLTRQAETVETVISAVTDRYEKDLDGVWTFLHTLLDQLEYGRPIVLVPLPVKEQDVPYQVVCYLGPTEAPDDTEVLSFSEALSDCRHLEFLQPENLYVPEPLRE